MLCSRFELPILLGLLANWLPGQAPPTPPKTPVRPVVDEYYGTKITDPYRWMEDRHSPELLSWMRAQDAYARAYLDHLPGYNALLQRCRKVETGDFQIQRVVRSGKRYVYAKLSPGDNLAKLYVRDDESKPEQLLYDPARQSTEKQHVSIGDFQISADGCHLSYLLMKGGGEFGDIHFIDLDTDRELPDVIPHTRWSAGSWAPGGNALLYLRFPASGSGHSASSNLEGITTVHHQLGTSLSADKPVFGYRVDPNLDIAVNEISQVEFIRGSNYAIASVNSGVSPESDFYITDAENLATGTPTWHKVASRTDKVKAVALHGEDIYLLSFKNASRYKILKTSARNPDASVAEVVVPATESVIRDIGAAKDGLYVNALQAGVLHIYKLDYATNSKEEIALPANTSGAIIAPDLTQSGTLIKLSSWTRAEAIYEWEPALKKLVNTEIAPQSSFEKELSDIEITRSEVHSWDGTRVPLVIFNKKAAERNGANPLVLTGYGDYGYPATSPYFLSEWVPWFEKGGMLAIAGVRGGGEYGEEWHLAGTVANKPNTWKDFIACAEYLIAQRYTSSAHLGAESESAGGIMIGNTITERPDLFRAVVMRAPLTNMLREETTVLGPFNTTEFGSLKTEEGFRAVLAMDAYQKVKEHTAYPAVLFEGGFDDPRVDPFFSAKMGARLQAATSSHRPILIDFFEDVGHGVGTSQEQTSQLQADELTFFSAELAQ